VAGTLDDTPYQSLYRRFRPGKFSEVLGQDHVVLALRNAVRDGRVAHAYLFSGPRGTGKTSTARILAKALNCTDLQDGEPCGVCLSCVEITKGTSLDVHELDAASNNGVDAMRDLVSRAALGTPGRQKVYIVDEVHMLSTAASNALLKTLEEPPAHVVFVLATTDPQKVLATIRSRTQHFEFRLLGAETLGDLLAHVRRDAHLDVPDEAIDIAVRRGRGSARDALSILDQVAASDTVDDDLPELDEIIEALAERDSARALVAVAGLTSVGWGPQQLAGDLVAHLREGFLASVAPELVSVTGSERQGVTGLVDRMGLAAVVRAMEVLGRSQVAMRDAPDPRVTLEVALVRLAHPELDDSPEALVTRLERLERSGAGTAHPMPAASSAPAAPAPASAPPTAAPASVPAPPDAADPTPDDEPVSAGTSSPAGTSPSKPSLKSIREGRAGRPLATPSPSPDSGRPDSGEVVPTVPPVATAATAAAVPPAAVPLPTVDELTRAWSDHVLARLRPKAKALFLTGRFVGTDDGSVRFGLPNEIHRQRCEDVRAEVEGALGDQFGRPIRLVLVVDDEPRNDGASRRPPEPEQPSEPRPERSGRPTMPAAAPGPRSDVPQAPPGPPDRVEDDEDLSVFEDAEVADVSVDNSPEARLLQAFPGAEEVQ